MYIVRICILRLLVDPNTPELLQGALQVLPESDSHPFVNEQVLLKLLHDLLRSSSAIPTPRRPASPSAAGEKMEE